MTPDTLRTTYDPEADAMYIYVAQARIIESEEVRPGLIIDFGEGDRIVGIEILDASRTVAQGATTRLPPRAAE